MVELIVAMTLTSIFAVLCVMLIYPIERTYKGTLKLARAQLLADTLIDSIRKECDDVKHDDKAAVWITNLSGDDDRQLLDTNHATNKSSGNTLVIRRNNNFSESIYASVGITSDIEDTNSNVYKVGNNTLTPTGTVHSIDTLIKAGADNLKSGYVHFGYYQGKEDDNGFYPIQAYDYTNPVMAKTYGNFTVELNFSLLALKNNKYPAYVMCTVKIMENGKKIYSRSAVLCFAANGSSHGSGSSNPVIPSKLTEVKVKVVWNDDGNTTYRPENGLSFTLQNSKGNILGVHNVTDVKTSNEQRFSFDKVELDKGSTMLIAPDPVSNYVQKTTHQGNVYLITYTRKIDVVLIPGPQFNGILKNHNRENITSVIFAKDTTQNQERVKNASYSCNVALDKDNKLVDDYKLYLVQDSGSYIAYVLSKKGDFIANTDMSSMFESCESLVQLTGFDLIKTDNTEDMHRMFKNCRKLTNVTGMIRFNWNTSKVKAFDSMFYNVACDDSITTNVTIDVSSFDFSQAQYYKKNGGDGKEVIGINKMFYTGYGANNEPDRTSHIGRIIFASGHKNMDNLNMLQEVFAGCDNLTSLEYFNDISFAKVEKFYRNFYSCPLVESADFSKWTFSNEKLVSVTGLFDGLSGLRTLNLNNLNIPHVTSTAGMFNNVGSLETVYLNKMTAGKVTSTSYLFKDKAHLTYVEMNGCTMSSVDSWTAIQMFYNCPLLEEVQITGFVNNKCTSVKEMFRQCKKLEKITGLVSWTTTGVTDFSRMFYDCGCDVTSAECIYDISGFGFSQNESVNIDMTSMFYNSGATKIKFPESFNATRVTAISNLFQNCKRLSEVENFILSTDTPTDAEAPVISFPNVTSVTNMFTYCSGLKNVKLNLYLPNCGSISNLFSNCANLANLNLSKSNFAACTKLQNLLLTCSSLQTVVLDEVYVPNCQTANNGFNNIFNSCGSLHYLYMRKANLSGLENFSFLPWGSLKELYLSEATLTGVTGMEGLFRDKTKIEKIDISNAVFGAYSSDEYLSAYQMFSGCKSLKTVLMKGFKAPKNCSEMFNGCTLLSTADFGDWNTVNTTNLNKMFFNCQSITSFAFSSWNTSEVTDMESMFENCYKLNGIDFTAFPNWNTGKVTKMKNMFKKCSYNSTETVSEGTYTINISNFDLSNVTDLESMFDCGDKNTDNNKDMLKEIILPSSANGGNPAATSVTNTMYMFRRRIHVKALTYSGEFETGTVLTKARSMFSRCGVEILDLRHINFSKLANSKDGSYYIFDNCEFLKTIIFASGTNLNISTFGGNEMFTNCKVLKGGNGTTFEAMKTADSGKYNSKKYALVDGLGGQPGYFTSPEQWEAQGH